MRERQKECNEFLSPPRNVRKKKRKRKRDREPRKNGKECLEKRKKGILRAETPGSESYAFEKQAK